MLTNQGEDGEVLAEKIVFCNVNPDLKPCAES